METLTCKTEKCGQTCEVKIASGFKDPKNKGRKYIKCLKCDSFSWIEENQNPKTSEEFKQSLEAPVTPQKGIETREPVPEDIPFKIRDFNAENRGKCRFGLLVARAENIGIVALTQLEVDEINRQVDFAMTGKLSSLPEDVEDIELPSETVREV